MEFRIGILFVITMDYFLAGGQAAQLNSTGKLKFYCSSSYSEFFGLRILPLYFPVPILGVE